MRMREMRKILCLLTSALMLMGLVSCHTQDTRDRSIIEFNSYKLLCDNPQSIEVKFDYTYIGSFTIVDEVQIKEICEILLARVYTLAPKLPVPGTTGASLKFTYDNETSILLSTYRIYEKNIAYVPSGRDNLEYLLQEIGIAKGALTER